MESCCRREPARVLVVGLIAVIVPLLFAQSARAQRQGSRMAFKQITRASWYGDAFKGARTASGSIFNPQGLTAAHRTLSLGTRVRVTDLRSGRAVIVRITDRGPYISGRGIDLSYGAARRLGIVRQGIAQVRVEPLPEPRWDPGPVVTASCWPILPWFPKAIAE